ncbi:bifunctional diguanylate cyclase/phosphodiesterase [Metabacillus fastidiosus]|uniref:bifunctional diguanylate cyclase/phosphodiesterase n=1 Tax=Metabacillus fastidiosus TaxID=1458 RepID=UPI003D2D4A48
MIKRRILIYSLLIIIFTSVVILTIANYQSTKKYVLTSVERETKELLSNFSAEAKRFSNERIVELELMAEYIVLSVHNEEELVQFLHKQNSKMPFFTGLGFINPEGEITASDGQQFPVKEKESFERALNGEVMFSDIFTLHQDSTKKVTAISVPVRKNGEIIGVLSGVVNMEDIIGELFAETSLPGSVFLLKDDEVVFSPSKDKSFQEIVPDVESLLNEISNNDNGSILIDKKLEHYIMYEHAWDDWVVVVDSGSNPDTGTISDTFWRNTLFVAVALLVIFIVLFYVRQLEKREKNMRKRDLLTGLGNRVQLEEDLALKLQAGHKMTLYFIDLDRFKEINERIGYQAGDQILFEVSRKLKQFADKDYLYRIGGDEFVFIANSKSEQEEKEIASEIVRMMENPLQVSGEGSIWITSSVGVRSSTSKDQVDIMMQDATFAVQEAKKKGGHQFVYFTEQLAALNENQRLLVNHLNSALEKGEFYLVYQPIYGFSSEKVVSFETLLRWKSPILGEVGPVKFISLLEENDSIIAVGRWLIREVALQVKHWENEGYKDIVVTLNVSVKQLLHPNFLHDVCSIIRETNVRPEMLVFEITESMVIQNIELATQTLLALNDLGIQIALDDFGTGYSSLSILKMLPIQYLKVDRTFVKEVESDGGVSHTILKGIIDIANGLQLKTVMEGVETIEQLTLLKKMGAHRIQGYFISKPVLPEIAIEFVHNDRLIED